MLKQHFRYLRNQTKRTQQLTAVIVIVVVAAIGTYLLLSSHAATPYATTTADKGSVTGNACLMTNPNASDGTDVEFGGSCGNNGTPTNTAKPLVTGTVATGDVLSATDGTWSNSPTSYTYQWQDCTTDGTSCSAINGATNQNYTVASSDSGHTLNVIVTAKNSAGSTESTTPTVPAIDTFTSASSINQSVWAEMNQQGDTSNNEVECYEPSQLGLNSSGLSITTQYVTNGFTCPTGTPGGSNPLNWLSGAVQMKSVNFTYGTIVVRAKMAGGVGAWPAIWLLGANCQQPNWLTGAGFNCSWPSDSSDSAEIDIAEDLGSNGRPTINENVFSNSLNSTCTYNTGSDLSSAFHNYEVDWSPGSLVFKVDGTTTSCSVTSSNVPSHPMFLIMNGAVCTAGSSCRGNSGTSNPDTSTFPQATTVAWVHASH